LNELGSNSKIAIDSTKICIPNKNPIRELDIGGPSQEPTLDKANELPTKGRDYGIEKKYTRMNYN